MVQSRQLAGRRRGGVLRSTCRLRFTSSLHGPHVMPSRAAHSPITRKSHMKGEQRTVHAGAKPISSRFHGHDVRLAHWVWSCAGACPDQRNAAAVARAYADQRTATSGARHASAAWRISGAHDTRHVIGVALGRTLLPRHPGRGSWHRRTESFNAARGISSPSPRPQGTGRHGAVQR